ncbi:unnamed protein product [Brachionus calyciflorus]|uniref:OTU domain-containing protein n=1 Tax=Brachionus calyciflorus TaxID=104777 RepID=A0A814ALS3_9BILA|nr:unnamed protein product [Brachionus calyciflorus]
MTTVSTTGDGNCLYNAISLSLCGTEEMSKEIKLGMIFIYFEYEKYFRKVFEKSGYEYNYEKMIEKSATMGVFGNEFNMLALSCLFMRPINCYSMDPWA